VTVEYRTVFGSLDDFRKGSIEVIDDDPKHYAFSNVFEVAGLSAPFEKVAVGKNQQYVLEVIRAEGVSGWRTCDHDEAVLCMDGEVTVRLVKLASPLAPAGKEGSIAVVGEPVGEVMGWVRIGRGHMALLPAGSAYRFEADHSSVLLQQTCLGDDTVERWAEICLS
jgi:quercetin dioxygenase-like cupin family protein